MTEEELYIGEAGWMEVPLGGVIPHPGSSTRFKTGDWRSRRPILKGDECTNCLICWIYCPDAAINRIDGGIEIDYEFCKGCGICSKECAVGAIEMVEE